jgi:hypothetical protein
MRHPEPRRGEGSKSATDQIPVATPEGVEIGIFLYGSLEAGVG